VAVRSFLVNRVINVFLQSWDHAVEAVIFLG
jgi:hypothetical protein